MNEVKEGIMRFVKVLNPEIVKDKKNIETITLDFDRLEEPEIKNNLKKEIMYLARLFK